MKIVRCEAWPFKLELEEPFTIAYSSIDYAVNVFLRLETNKGLMGFGCAAPDEEVTGETDETILSALQNTAIPALEGRDPSFIPKIITELEKELDGQPTALAAVDMALYDLAAKRAGLPLYKYLGAYRSCMPTSVTIGIQSLENTLAKALAWKKRGFISLKLKGGNNLQEDIEKCRKVREAVGPDIELRFDANQGFSREKAIQFIQGAEAAELSVLEQPIDKLDLTGLRVVSDSGAMTYKIPVMADEAVLSPEDTAAIERAGGADAYNIKLAKSGGLYRAAEIDAIARAAAAPTMIGCMDEAGLGVAAGLHFALSRPNVAFADLDGHLEFTNDPSYHAVQIDRGIVYPLETPGIGFEFT
ncbi:MAG: dipeptide epimerase [Spirochaetia bacterium]|nr:dipeptide epimerase [Spirochaetia bacterium]